MTEPVKLTVEEVTLVTIIMLNGAYVPVPLVVLNDETPLYEEDFTEQLEKKFEEGQSLETVITITNVTPYNDELLTVTATGEELQNSYQFNMPRQFLQIGKMYSSLLKVPAFVFMIEEEMNLHLIDDGAAKLTKYTNIPYNDLVFVGRFPIGMTVEQNRQLAEVLNPSSTDDDQLEDREIGVLEALGVSAPKTQVTSREFDHVRGDLLDIILSLINGSEDALIALYEYGQNIDAAYEAAERQEPYSYEEKKALLAVQLIQAMFSDTAPTMMMSQIVEDEEELEEINAFQSVIFESAKDLNRMFDDVLNDYYKDNPTMLMLTEDSSKQERLDYLGRATNTIPLLGGLAQLSDRINMDLLYGYDWNKVSELSKDDFHSYGELSIILTLVIAQRVQMIAKATEQDKTPEELNLAAMALLSWHLTRYGESSSWVLHEGMQRMASTQPLVFDQYLHLAVHGEEGPEVLQSAFGALLHWFGHTVIQEEWNLDMLMITYSEQPIIREFLQKVVANKDNQDPDDEEAECYVSPAMMEIVEEYSTSEVITELREALTLLAELNVMKTAGYVKDSEEWTSSVKDYLQRISL